jgi:hypothetical protein
LSGSLTVEPGMTSSSVGSPSPLSPPESRRTSGWFGSACLFRAAVFTAVTDRERRRALHHVVKLHRRVPTGSERRVSMLCLQIVGPGPDLRSREASSASGVEDVLQQRGPDALSLRRWMYEHHRDRTQAGALGRDSLLVTSPAPSGSCRSRAGRPRRMSSVRCLQHGAGGRESRPAQ